MRHYKFLPFNGEEKKKKKKETRRANQTELETNSDTRSKHILNAQVAIRSPCCTFKPRKESQAGDAQF